MAEKDKVTSSSIVFAVDTSGSMSGIISTAIQQTRDFVGVYVGPESWQYKVGLIDFGGSAEVTQTVTQDRGAILSGLQHLLDSGNGGASEDTANAIVTASGMLVGSTGRKIVIVFTDEDFQSYANTYQEAVDSALSQDIEVFFITNEYRDSSITDYLNAVRMSQNPMSHTTIGAYPIEEIIKATRGKQGYGIVRIGDFLDDGETLKIIANQKKVKMYISGREVAVDGAYFKTKNDKLEAFNIKMYYNDIPILKHGSANSNMSHWVTTSSKKVLYNFREEDEDTQE